jgi:hypothetical protein
VISVGVQTDLIIFLETLRIGLLFNPKSLLA